MLGALDPPRSMEIVGAYKGPKVKTFLLVCKALKDSTLQDDRTRVASDNMQTKNWDNRIFEVRYLNPRPPHCRAKIFEKKSNGRL